MGNILCIRAHTANISNKNDNYRELEGKLELLAQRVERRLDRHKRISNNDDNDEIWSVRAVASRKKNRYHTQLTGSSHNHRVIETNATCAARVLVDADHDLRLAGARCIGVIRDPDTNVVTELVYECHNALAALADTNM